MQRAVTAIYPSYATASLVRDELNQLGVGGYDVTIIPDTEATGLAGGTGDVDSAMERLHDLGLPEDDTRTYQQALRNGDYVVSASLGEDVDLAQVQEIMRRPEDAYDLDHLDNQYRSAEYMPRLETSGMQMAADTGRRSQADLGSQQQGYASSSSMGQSTGMGTGMGQSTGMGTGLGLGASGTRGEEFNEDGTVKVVEERLAVGKRDVDMGAVRVRSYVREEPVSAEVDLRATRVFVERRPVDRAVSGGDLQMRDQVIEAREHMEQPVVAKEARVVEEIGLRQETETVHETIQDTVRKTEVEIEDSRTGDTTRLSGQGSRDGSDRDRF